MFVSILIPCYNAEPWIAKAIESALAQTWASKEVIVVDDGSTDGSLDEIQKFDGQIRWETGPNQGGNRARNRLTELAQGEWLQYLDADDYLLPEKVANQVEFIESNPNADVVFGPLLVEYTKDGKVHRDLHKIHEPHDDAWILLARWHLPQTGSPLFRRTAICEVGGWAPDQLCCQEHELYLRLLKAGKSFQHCDKNGSVYRQWTDRSVSTKNIARLHKQRLKIEESLEDFLRSNRELTPGRLAAINQARFEIARSAWQYDPSFAVNIIDSIKTSQPSFAPASPAARFRYRLIYKTLGFQMAERLAQKQRRELQS